MKKFLLLLTAVFMSCYGVAGQDKKFFLEGSVTLGAGQQKVLSSEVERKHDLFSNVTYMPAIGYMFHKNWSVSVGVGYSYQKDHTGGIGDDAAYVSSKFFLTEASVSYYLRLSEKFRFRPTISGGYMSGKFKDDSITDFMRSPKPKGTGFYVGITPIDFEFKPVANIGINLSLGHVSFQRTELKTRYNDIPEKTTTNTWDISLNNSYKVGFRFYF